MEEITDINKTLNVAVLGPLGTYTHEVRSSIYRTSFVLENHYRRLMAGLGPR